MTAAGDTARPPSVRIYHNNLWAKYKGAIFSAIYARSSRMGLSTSFVQIAETDAERSALANVDLSYHEYPFRLLFGGPYDYVPWYRLVAATTADLLRNASDLVVLPGYHRIEYWTMLLLCMLLGRRRAVFCDSTDSDRRKSYFREKAKRLFFRCCDGFFCYGIRSKEYIGQYVSNEDKIFFRCQAAALPHGYDADAVMAHYRQGVDPAGNPRFIYLGRLAAEKGLFDLIDALRAVRESIPGVQLDVVGSGSLREDLVDRVNQAGLEAAVSFLGSKDPEEIGALLMRSTALVLPSHREPWGLVVNEALSYGCPAVVSDVCGCVPELVVTGISGFSYPVGDVAALSAAMVQAVQFSADRQGRAQACLELISRYTPQQAAEEILRGCASLLPSA
jgi:glycosyltransferase involved in cell wall biosynthesis